MMRSFVAPRRRPPARLQGRAAITLEGAIQNEPVSSKVRTRGARPGHQSLMRPAIPSKLSSAPYVNTFATAVLEVCCGSTFRMVSNAAALRLRSSAGLVFAPEFRI